MLFMIKQIFLSVIVWVVSITLILVLFLAMLFFSIILFPFDKMRKVPHAQCYWWADAMILLNPYWNISASGLENIDHDKTYVIVANHQSLADIVVAYKTRMQFKWVAKESLFKLPVLGWCMSLGKHISLSRGDFGSIKNVYREAAFWLRSGMSILFFPEGTRSNTGEMRDFQNGAFKLAIKERVPVLPICIKGTGEAIPRGSWLFTAKIPATLKVLKPIDTSLYKSTDFARLRDDARAMMESA